MGSQKAQNQTSLPAQLSNPAKRALLHAGIYNLEDLAKFTKKDISMLHGVGPKTVKTLEHSLSENRLSFKDET